MIYSIHSQRIYNSYVVQSSHTGTPETYGSLLVWDSIMPRIKNTYDKIQKQQLPYR